MTAVFPGTTIVRAPGQEVLVVQNTAPLLVSYPPVVAGTTPGVTVKLYPPSQQMPAVGVAASRDDNIGSLVVAAARGARSLDFTSSLFSTPTAGRRYLVVDATTGAPVVVEAAAASDANHLCVKDPIPCALAVGSQLNGLAVYYQLTTQQTALVGRGVAEWNATMATGEVVTWRQDLRVVWALPSPQIAANDVVGLSPYCARMQPPDDPGFDKTFLAAYQLHVLPALSQQGLAPERIVSWESLTPWLVAACEHFLADELDPDEPTKDRKAKKLAAARESAMQSFRFWYDPTENLALPGEDAELPHNPITFCSR